MVDKNNNPAGRLHSILSTMKVVSGQSLLRAWASALGVSERDMPKFFRRYGEALGLPVQICNQLQSIPELGKVQLYLKWLPPLERALSQMQLNSSSANFFGSFDNAAFDNLETAAQMLSMRRPEKTVDPKALRELAQNARQLRLEANASDIDARLKDLVIENLDRILDAIEEYNIVGVAALEREVERTIGSWQLKKRDYEELSKQPSGRRYFRLIWNILQVLNALNGVVQLPHDLQKLIPHTDNQQEAVIQVDRPLGSDWNSVPDGDESKHPLLPAAIRTGSGTSSDQNEA